MQLNDAKRQAAEILAVTRAQVARQAGSAAVGVLDASMRSLNIAAEAIGGDAVPAVPLRTVPGVHRGGCFAAAFDVAGGVAATCGCDKLVRLWDVMRCTETATLRVRPWPALSYARSSCYSIPCCFWGFLIN